MPESATDMSIGQVAERTGLSVHTLRFYEREGVIAGTVRRNVSGRRVYDESDVEWLMFCIGLRGSGMPLPEIRRYAELVRAGRGNEEARLEILRAHQERVTKQMEELSRSLERINFKVNLYEDRLKQGASDPFWTALVNKHQTG